MKKGKTSLEIESHKTIVNRDRVLDLCHSLNAFIGQRCYKSYKSDKNVFWYSATLPRLPQPGLPRRQARPARPVSPLAEIFRKRWTFGAGYVIIKEYLENGSRSRVGQIDLHIYYFTITVLNIILQFELQDIDQPAASQTRLCWLNGTTYRVLPLPFAVKPFTPLFPGPRCWLERGL